MRGFLITILFAGIAGCAQPQRSTPLTVIENSIGMKFVRIPAGEFQMGSDETVDTLLADFPTYVRDHLPEPDDEQPVHRVRISKDFFLANLKSPSTNSAHLLSSPVTRQSLSPTARALMALTRITTQARLSGKMLLKDATRNTPGAIQALCNAGTSLSSTLLGKMPWHLLTG